MPNRNENTNEVLAMTATPNWLAAADGDDSPKLATFTMEAYTGDAMRPGGWGDPIVVDLAGLKVSAKSRPILFAHDPQRPVGHTTDVKINAQNIEVAGVISAETDEARNVVAAGKNGFPWQASIGAKVARVEFLEAGETATVNGREVTGPLNIARQATLGEVSFVALGADDATSAHIAAQQQKEFGMPEQTPASSEPTKTPPTKVEAASAPPAQPQPDPVANMRAAASAEATRIAGVTAATEGNAEIRATAIAEGWTADKAELETLRAARPQAPAAGTSSPSMPDGQALEAAMAMHTGIKEADVVASYGEKTVEAARKQYRNASLGMMLHEVIAAAGQHVRPGRIDNEVIRAAFQASNQLEAAGMSTISLPGILGNVANKHLLASFLAVDSVVDQFCAEVDHSDFKTHTKYRLTMGGEYADVGPSGELKHDTHSEESYTNQVGTKGKIVGLTRQDIINDDLGAFTATPQRLGRQGAIAKEKAVFTLLLANTGAFYHADNNNLVTSSALNIANLGVAEQTMMDQQDANGDPAMIKPEILLVGTALNVTASDLYNETRVNNGATSKTTANNPHAGKFRPVVSPWINAQGLTGSSATDWRLFANPADAAAMEIAYLQGKRQPTIESGQADFNTLGVQFRAFFDFGVAFQETRASVKMEA